MPNVLACPCPSDLRTNHGQRSTFAHATRYAVNRDTPPLIVPGPALVNDSHGSQVAVVENGVAHFKKVGILPVHS